MSILDLRVTIWCVSRSYLVLIQFEWLDLHSDGLERKKTNEGKVKWMWYKNEGDFWSIHGLMLAFFDKQMRTVGIV